nr:acetyl-CoA carboxylase biotin carboxyl carrier protein [Thalassobacillus sp. C254]
MARLRSAEKIKEKITIRKEGVQQTVSVPQAAVQTAPAPVPAPQPEQPKAEEPKQDQGSEKPKNEAASKHNDDSLKKITSPMVGTFYEAPNPESDPYVKEGDKVSPDTVVCIVEAMKLMNELEAEVSGEIVEVLVENGELVEYGQPLFLVKPN